MSGLFSRLFGTKSAALTWFEAADVRSRLGNVLLVDVREPEEYHSAPGHLPGALNVPLAEVQGRADELAAAAGAKSVVLVCKTDRRSARAAEALIAAGLRDVAVLRGGTDGWHAQGLELE